MNWQNSILFAVIFLVLSIALLRSEPRIRSIILGTLILPIGVLSIRWASFRNAWQDLTTGLGIGFVALVLWWLTIGRKLPHPTGNHIRVWTEEDPFE